MRGMSDPSSLRVLRKCKGCLAHPRMTSNLFTLQIISPSHRYLPFWRIPSGWRGMYVPIKIQINPAARSSRWCTAGVPFHSCSCPCQTGYISEMKSCKYALPRGVFLLHAQRVSFQYGALTTATSGNPGVFSIAGKTYRNWRTSCVKG